VAVANLEHVDTITRERRPIGGARHDVFGHDVAFSEVSRLALEPQVWRLHKQSGDGVRVVGRPRGGVAHRQRDLFSAH
jgi:hypothetical protein